MIPRPRPGYRTPEPDTVRWEIWQAMPVGEWVSRRQVLERCDTTDWPRSRAVSVTALLHRLVGDGVAQEVQFGNGEWIWRRLI